MHWCCGGRGVGRRCAFGVVVVFVVAVAMVVAVLLLLLLVVVGVVTLVLPPAAAPELELELDVDPQPAKTPPITSTIATYRTSSFPLRSVVQPRWISLTEY